MCLLITGPAGKIRSTLLNTNGLIHDIYTSNKDGVGAMYATAKNKLRCPKIVPANENQFRNFVSSLPQDDRPLALHARYATHGDKDTTNCHPYSVIPGRLALMHNGVLSQGNNADRTKSDTWHYIKNVVRPLVEVYPDIFTNAGWQALVESDITSGNRFALMDNTGALVVLNKRTGIEHDGMWFSNTYAWSPELLIPGYAKPVTYTPYTGAGHWRGYTGDDTDVDPYAGFGPVGAHKKKWWNRDNSLVLIGGGKDFANSSTPKEKTTEELAADEVPPVNDTDGFIEDVWAAIDDCDPHVMANCLMERPYTTLLSITRDCVFECSVDPDTELSPAEADIVKLLVTQDIPILVNRINRFGTSNAEQIAEVMCWYGDWLDKASSVEEPEPEPEVDEDLVSRALAMHGVDNEAFAV